ncbi:MAG: hypothetical protein K9M07_01755 [Simkaniaceae bacterium]|nr:hypothetical protein [Simkaniaceae bacterium]MCF7851947.1 hypothetical protein [Simkaniaceae bacterium]
MKTNYQKFLEVCSLAQKGKASPQEILKRAYAFLDEAKQAFDSGLEVKRVAAIQKLKSIIELFEEMKKEQMIVEVTEDSFENEEEKEAYRRTRDEVEKKIQEVLQAYEKQIDQR